MTGRWSVVIALLAAACAATPAGAAQRYVDPVFQEVAVESDIAYGQALNNRGELQTLELDVYRPAADSATSRPAVVLAHGGGFRNGERTHTGLVPIARGLAQRGYVALSIEYRLRPAGTTDARTDPEIVAEALTGDSPTIRDAQHDMQAAVRWVRANAGVLGVNPALIAAGGESAGAITAWETAVNPHDPGTSGNPGHSSAVAAALSLWGAADPDHIEAGAPPVLDIHGGADTTVPLAFGAQACGLMLAWGSVCELVVLPPERHAPFNRTAEVLEESSSFLCRRMIPGCPVSAPVPVRLR